MGVWEYGSVFTFTPIPEHVQPHFIILMNSYLLYYSLPLSHSHTPTLPHFPLSSKHRIVFINACLVFQGIFFSHWKIIHFIHIQDPLQIGMTDKIDPVKIIGLPFHPVG